MNDVIEWFVQEATTRAEITKLTQGIFATKTVGYYIATVTEKNRHKALELFHPTK